MSCVIAPICVTVMALHVCHLNMIVILALQLLISSLFFLSYQHILSHSSVLSSLSPYCSSHHPHHPTHQPRPVFLLLFVCYPLVVHVRTVVNEQEKPRGLPLTRGSVWSSLFNQETSLSPCLKSRYALSGLWSQM